MLGGSAPFWYKQINIKSSFSCRCFKPLDASSFCLDSSGVDPNPAACTVQTVRLVSLVSLYRMNTASWSPASTKGSAGATPTEPHPHPGVTQTPAAPTWLSPSTRTSCQRSVCLSLCYFVLLQSKRFKSCWLIVWCSRAWRWSRSVMSSEASSPSRTCPRILPSRWRVSRRQEPTTRSTSPS